MSVSAEPLGALESFIGRDQQLSELVGLLEEARLITLTGAPGIGKSRLGLELADRLPGARQVVELAAVTRPADVPRAVAAALSVQEVAGQSLTDVLVARLSRHRALLVLDNCEHLLEGCRELIEALLSGCPELRVLATSREPLGLAAERVWQVPPLTLPAGDEETSPEELLDYPAVALFSQRAAAGQPGFSLNVYVAPAVVEICRRLDGIPLAIELAAARAKSHTPEEIARRLEDRFTLLTNGAGDALPHHQTLQAALDWSHELLSGPERTLLRRLAVFAGGFELEAAEQVCAGGEIEAGAVAELLTRLVAKSLVISDPPSPRFGLLETVRLYATERLEETGELAERRLSHARFFLGLAERAEPELTGADQVEWLERLEAEQANLRAALQWSLSHGEADETLRLAGALVLFWRVRCHFSEGRELLEAAVSVGHGASPALQAKALWGAGFMALMAGDSADAMEPLEESLSLYSELGDAKGCGRALLVLGNCMQACNGPRAQSLLEESAARAREAGDLWCLAHALALAGFDHSSRYDLVAARPLFEESLVVAGEAQDKQGRRLGLVGLGSVAFRQGDFSSAESVLEEAVSLTCELGEDYIKAMALECLGQLTMARGEYGRAAELFDEALALIRDVGHGPALPNLLAARARAAHANGDRAHARILLEEAVALAGTGRGSPIPALRAMGQLAADDGDLSTAQRLFDEALKLARARGDKAGIAQALGGCVELARARGGLKRAAVLNHEALELWREIGSAPGIVARIEAVGGLDAGGGRYRRAACLLGAAEALREQNGYARLPWESSRYEADVALIRCGLTVVEFQSAFAEGAAFSLAEAIREASNGRSALERSPVGWPSLTDRERAVAALVAEGLTNPQIADRLFVSLGTVKFHVSRIFRKLGVADRSELAREFWNRGEEPFPMKE